jgi:hypothetical protein
MDHEEPDGAAPVPLDEDDLQVPKQFQKRFQPATAARDSRHSSSMRVPFDARQREFLTTTVSLSSSGTGVATAAKASNSKFGEKIICAKMQFSLETGKESGRNLEDLIQPKMPEFPTIWNNFSWVRCSVNRTSVHSTERIN